ncbi:hypothetical protein [Nocardia sp. CA-135398]
MNTTNNPGSGWYDIESGRVYAATDGYITPKTGRLINGPDMRS